MLLEGKNVMKATTYHKCPLTFLGCVGLLILAVVWFPATSAKAALTPQAMSGTVEVLVAGEQSWKPLTAAMQIKGGDQIRTNPGSSVELWFDDGSLVRLEEATQLVISELEISIARKTRIARFSLQTGTVFAKITKLGFTESLCEIETPGAVVDMKFAEVEVIASEGGMQTLVTALQGEIDIVKTREGEVTISGMLDDQEGVIFSLSQIGGRISLGVQRIVRKITLTGEGAIQGLRTMLGGSDNTLKVDNMGASPVEVEYYGITARLDQDRAATFGLPLQDELLLNLAGDEQGFDLAAQKNFALWYKTRATQYDGLYVFADKGPIYVNGEVIETGSFELFVPDQALQPASRALSAPEEEAPDTRALQPQVQEQPVAPPAPETDSPEGAIEPTPVPTVTPTPTPTEPPEELEPTPTPTPTPTMTPTPKPTQQPPSPPRPTPVSPFSP